MATFSLKESTLGELGRSRQGWMSARSWVCNNQRADMMQFLSCKYRNGRKFVPRASMSNNGNNN